MAFCTLIYKMDDGHSCVSEYSQKHNIRFFLRDIVCITFISVVTNTFHASKHFFKKKNSIKVAGRLFYPLILFLSIFDDYRDLIFLFFQKLFREGKEREREMVEAN